MPYEKMKIGENIYEITVPVDGTEEVFTCITGVAGIAELDDLVAFRVAAIRQERTNSPVYGTVD